MGFKAIFNTAVLAAIVGTTPNLSGQVAELEITALTEQLSVPNFYEVSIAEYRRGWFSSEVDFRVDVPWLDALSEEDLSEFIANDFTLHITHGPLIYIDGSVIIAAAAEEMDFRPEWSRTEEVDLILGAQPLVHSTFITHFNGEISGESTLPEIDYTDEQKGISVKMSGYSGNFIYSSSDRHYDSNVVMPQLTVQSSEVNIDMVDLEIAVVGSDGQFDATYKMPLMAMQSDDVNFDMLDIQMDIDIDKITDYIWGGESSIKVGVINVNAADALFSMDGLTLSSNAWDEGPVIHGDMIFEIQSIHFDDLEITDSKFNITLRNLDIEAIDKYYEMMFGFGGDVNQLQNMLLKDGPELAILFLKRSPEYIVRDFSFTMPEGTLTATGGMHFDGSGNKLVLGDIAGLMQRISSEGQVTIPVPLIRSMTERTLASQLAGLNIDVTEEQKSQMVQQTIDSLVMQGLLVAEDDVYRSDLSYENGQLTLNGKEIPLPM